MFIFQIYSNLKKKNYEKPIRMSEPGKKQKKNRIGKKNHIETFTSDPYS
jgi:hypothetical protein